MHDRHSWYLHVAINERLSAGNHVSRWASANVCSGIVTLSTLLAQPSSTIEDHFVILFRPATCPMQPFKQIVCFQASTFVVSTRETALAIINYFRQHRIGVATCLVTSELPSAISSRQECAYASLFNMCNDSCFAGRWLCVYGSCHLGPPFNNVLYAIIACRVRGRVGLPFVPFRMTGQNASTSPAEHCQ